MSTFVPKGNQPIKTTTSDTPIPPPYCGDDHYEPAGVPKSADTGTLNQFPGWANPADEFRVDL
jgi:hypothetical protein